MSKSLCDTCLRINTLQCKFCKEGSNYKNVEHVLYVCDRKACEQCDDQCYLTSDINHAKNFRRDMVMGCFLEQHSSILSNHNLTKI